jgi:high affinity Mn2+ porin
MRIVFPALWSLLLLYSPVYADDAPPAPFSPSDPIKARLLPFYNDDWSVYGDATAIYQGYPSFHAAYSGPQSLPSSAQGNNLEVADLFIGRRLWEGGAIYIDPQFYRGFGLNGSLGVAGFPDGEANKGGSVYVNPELARAYLQQIIGLGGPTETLERGPNQLREVADVSRLTITGGKFSYTDQFDSNAYSHDPETQFMNWGFMDSLAWDWAQDTKGFAWGGVLELNQKNWALRYGAMVPVNEVNGDRFRLHGGNELDHALELEERYSFLGRPGKTRFLVFYNRERAGDFEEALAMGGDINTALADTREYGRVEYGFALNMEQQLKDDLGAFARLSWNNGAVENLGFTQADQSVAAGLSLQGKRWQRDDDVAGFAVAVNGVSGEQRKALQAGYVTGLVIGDGSLRYSGESILESYYNYKLTDYAFLGPDYQLVINPAYNTDRGPVSIFALRLNAKF